VQSVSFINVHLHTKSLYTYLKKMKQHTLLLITTYADIITIYVDSLACQSHRVPCD